MNEHDGYILYGGTNDSTYLGDPGIIKIDSVGNVVWKKYYHRSGYEFVIYQNSIELGMNVPWGGEIGVTTWLNDTSGLNPYWGLYRFDGKGDTLWTRNYQDTTNLVISQIEIPRDNKYLIYGGWDYFPTHGLGFCTIFLRKTDSLGNIIWTRTYHSTNSHIRDPAGIDTCKDGGYILCAYEYDTIPNYSKLACLNGEIMIMKTDSGGNTKWIKYITNPICDVVGASIKALKNGGYLVCGYWDDSLNWNGNTAYTHMYMAKLNDTGSLVWSHTYGISNRQGYTVLCTTRELPNGDIVGCGYSQDSLKKGITGVILRTDSNGNQKWFRYYYKFYPTNEDYLSDINLTSDGGFIASGFTYDNPENFWVVKTDSLGCDTIGCNFTGIEQIKENDIGVKVFPNPSTGQFTLSLSNVPEKCNVEVYNVLGERVESEKVKGESEEIDLSGQPNGIYLYRVITENGGLVGSGKVIIER